MSIVEKMARAIYEAGGFEYVSRTVFPGGGTPYGQWAVAVEQARAALTATGLTEAQLEGLANGTMVVVKAGAPGENYVRVRESRYREMLTDMLDHAYSAGSVSNGQWSTAGMADAEWLARKIGANEFGQNRVGDVRRRIGDFIERAMLAAKEG